MSHRNIWAGMAAFVMTSLFAVATLAHTEPAELRIAAPAGTRVIIDGERHGVTPLEPIRLDAGRHRVVFHLRTGHVGRAWLDLAAGSTSRAVVRTREVSPRIPLSGQVGRD